MIESVIALLALTTFITGFWILLKNTWDFELRDLFKRTDCLVYVVVCLSTAASFGAIFTSFIESPSGVENVALSINRVLGLVSILGFHVLSKGILEDKK